MSDLNESAVSITLEGDNGVTELAFINHSDRQDVIDFIVGLGYEVDRQVHGEERGTWHRCKCGEVTRDIGLVMDADRNGNPHECYHTRLTIKRVQ